jgi:hypothetical protein
MLDASFSKWIDNLSEDPHFANVMNISDRQEEEAYDVESVLRFLAIVRTEREALVRMGDVGDFLTRRMRDFIAESGFDLEDLQQVHDGPLLALSFDSSARRRASRRASSVSSSRATRSSNGSSGSTYVPFSRARSSAACCAARSVSSPIMVTALRPSRSRWRPAPAGLRAGHSDQRSSRSAAGSHPA